MPRTDPHPTRERDDEGKPLAAPRTPTPDIQPADAGTPASGNTTPASNVMKQTSKTAAERGAREH